MIIIELNSMKTSETRKIFYHHGWKQKIGVKILQKVQFKKYKNTLFCYFKNDKKSIFAQEKSLKLPKMQFSDLFPVQKLIFGHF